MQNICQTSPPLCWACLYEGTSSENCHTESLFGRTIVCWSIGCNLYLVTGSDSDVEDLEFLAGFLHWVGIKNFGFDYNPLFPLGCCCGLDIYCSLTGSGIRNQVAYRVPLPLPLHVDWL